MRKQMKAFATMAAAVALVMASTVTSLARVGWVDVNKHWYYYDEAGNSVTNQWIEKDGYKYWLKENGEMAVQMWVPTSDGRYWVNERGTMITDSWVPVTNNWYYVGQDGKMIANTWFEYGNQKYYLTESGAAAKGWTEIDGKTYYFDRISTKMAKDTTVDGYKLDENGVRVQ